MDFHPCETCKKIQYVHDTTHDAWICTGCGTVERRYQYSDLRHTYTDSQAVQAVPPPATHASRAIVRLNRQMQLRSDPGQARRDRFERITNDYADMLHMSSRIRQRAIFLFSNMDAKLNAKLVAACLVIGARSVGFFTTVRTVERVTGLRGLSATIKRVCAMQGISQRAVTLGSLPYFINVLELPYKSLQTLRQNYIELCRQFPSLGTETRIALACYKLVFSLSGAVNESQLGTIVQHTGINASTLQHHISRL